MSSNTSTTERNRLSLSTEMPNVIVREYTPDDIEEVMKLALKNRDPLTNGRIQPAGITDFAERTAQNTQPDGTYGLGVWLNGNLVGGINAGMDSKTELEISYYTDSDHARQGIAKAAVGAVVDWASHQGYDVVAHVTRDNISSTQLLKKIGFAFSKFDYEQHDQVYRYEAKSTDSTK